MTILRLSLLCLLIGSTLAVEIDLDTIEPGEKATGQREGKMARAAYDPAATIIDRWLFPMRAEMQTISKPPGLKYRDLATRTNRTDIYAMVYYPHDWQPSDRRPVTVYAYGSGWNGVRMGRPQTGAGEGAYWTRFGGMVVVSTHYRTGLSESMADGVSAVRWTRQHADKLGIATDRVTGGGGSSGGHIMLSTTVITDGPENPWDDASISKACQYHYGQVAVPSRPQHPKLSPAHNLRDGLPPYVQFIGTKDKAWGEFAYQFKKNAEGIDLPFWFMEYEGGGHGWKGPGHYRVKYQIADFLHTYGAMDVIHYGLPGARFDLADMEQFFLWQGLKPGMTLTVDGGGSIDGTSFVDDGKPGMSVVTATSTVDPKIVRHAYISIGQQAWAEDATASGKWSSKDYKGHSLMESTDDAASLTFSLDLPPGEWMAYAVRWKDPYFIHNGTKVSVTGSGAEAEAVVDLSKQQEHFHIPLTAFSNKAAGSVKVTLARGPWDDKQKKPTRTLPIAAWGLVVLPRYTGGVSNLPYKRGHLRYETFGIGAGEDGDDAIGP